MSKILLAVPIIVALAGCAGIPSDTGYTMSGDPLAIDSSLVVAANRINADCPQMVDADTRLDNALALPNNEFQYNFTVISQSREALNSELMQSSLTPRILKAVRDQKSMDYFIENRVTIIYNYHDKNGLPLFSVRFGVDEYR